MTLRFGTSGMPPKKLSDSDKQEILDRYRHQDETTITLSAQYGVSTSTISRILKQSLPEDEYEALVQRKRQGMTRSHPDQELLPGILPRSAARLAESEEAEDAEVEDSGALSSDWNTSTPVSSSRRQRKRSAAGSISVEQLAASAAHLSQLDLAPSIKRDDLAPDSELILLPKKVLDPIVQIPAVVTADDFAGLAEEEDEDEEEDLEDEEDLDEEDEDLEDDFDGVGFEDELRPLEAMPLAAGAMKILPLAEAAIPHTCYVVVDRASELITRPLKEFADLGKLPTEEARDKTLPIFDNHRVAKRFLRRMQRIVKVPDGRIFQKVKPYLQAKGITHLLIDGQIYSLQ
jgi:Eukaryotic mitochondrial regulator protein